MDSEKLYLDMNRKFFKELGAEISREEHLTFVGISATTMWKYIREKFDLPQTVDELKEMEKELKYEMLKKENLIPSKHIITYLQFLKENGNTLAIASSGLRKNIDLILSKLGMEVYFDLIVSGEQVTKGKPEPDIFQMVSRHFGRAPGECIVIEDSKNGVLAAKAAQMFCIGYRNPTSGNQDLSPADIIIDHFQDSRLFQLVT